MTSGSPYSSGPRRVETTPYGEATPLVARFSCIPSNKLHVAVSKLQDREHGCAKRPVCAATRTTKACSELYTMFNPLHTNLFASSTGNPPEDQEKHSPSLQMLFVALIINSWPSNVSVRQFLAVWYCKEGAPSKPQNGVPTFS